MIRETIRRTMPALLLVLALPPTSRAWAQTGNPSPTDPQQAVDRFYPDDRLTPATAADRHTCHAVLETTSTGAAALIVAAYADRLSGAVRVLRRDAAGSLQVAHDAPVAWAFPGARCTVHLRDVDFDGSPEIFVSFHQVRVSVAWLFRWNGSTLTNLTPTEPAGGRASSRLLSPLFFDLEHAGALRIVSLGEIGTPPPGMPARRPGVVYRLGPNGYEVEKSVLVVLGFRADVAAAGNVRSFRLVTDSSAPFTLRVVNGDRTGRNRVTGVSIRLNDVEVLGPDDVTATTAFRSTVLPSLPVANRLTATLTGPPEAQIIVIVEDATGR